MRVVLSKEKNKYKVNIFLLTSKVLSECCEMHVREWDFPSVSFFLHFLFCCVLGGGGGNSRKEECFLLVFICRGMQHIILIQNKDFRPVERRFCISCPGNLCEINFPKQ